jgi:hemerythrin
MKHFQYPGFSAHNGQHKSFVNKLRSKENMTAIDSGEAGILQETAGFMKNWLFTHVAVQDKSLLWYFKKQKEPVLAISKQLIQSGDAALKRKHINLYKKILDK